MLILFSYFGSLINLLYFLSNLPYKHNRMGDTDRNFRMQGLIMKIGRPMNP